MRRTSVVRTAALSPLLLFFLFALAGCEGEESGGDGTLATGAFCDTGFQGDCVSGICRDVLGGESCSIGCTVWTQASNEGTICTVSCTQDADCQGFDIAAASGEQVSDEVWFCSSGVCHVIASPPMGQSGNICSGCGFPFCAGRCIGCPQC